MAHTRATKTHGPDVPDAHAVQQRTHAGDINVAPTLPAVPTRTDEKTAGHHDRTAAYPVGAPFMTPGTEAVRQTPTRHNGAHAAQQRTLAGDTNVAPTLTAVPIRATGKSVGELENPDALTGFSHHLKKKGFDGFRKNTFCPRSAERNENFAYLCAQVFRHDWTRRGHAGCPPGQKELPACRTLNTCRKTQK